MGTGTQDIHLKDVPLLSWNLLKDFPFSFCSPNLPTNLFLGNTPSKWHMNIKLVIRQGRL